MRATRPMILLVALLAALAAAPAAGAVTMTLQSTTVNDDGIQGPASNWSIPPNGGTVTWTTETWTGTYTFNVPTTVPEGGAPFDMTVKAEARKNGYGYHTRFAPAMSARGAMVTGGQYFQRVDLYADANSETKPTDTQSAQVTLKPVGTTFTIGIQDGPTYTFTYKSDAPPPATATPFPTPIPKPVSGKCAKAGPTARAAAINEVRVIAVNPDVQFHKAGTPEDNWCSVEKDTVLQQGDEISCDPDGRVLLQFADNSTVTVFDTTQLKIASFFTEGGVVRTEILLFMGRVAAKVNKSEATKSDFRIKSPTGTTSVRGTEFEVAYDPGSKATRVSVKSGVVEYAPDKTGLPKRTLGPGQEMEATANSVSKIAKVGKAGLRKGGLTRWAALGLVTKLLKRQGVACGFTTPRGTNVYAIKPSKRGWTVTVKLVGRVAGQSRWLVAGKKVKASGPLAKAIAKGCR